ncbi:MAG: hypothetical protein U0610_07930 [bacterium]
MTGESPRRPRFAALLVAALAVCAATAEHARAQTGIPFDEYGAGARSSAMGQAFTGIADDPSAAYYNPAGLAWAPVQTALGFRYVKPSTSYSTTCKVVRYGTCPSFGITEPVPPAGTQLPIDIDFDSPALTALTINTIADLDYDAVNAKLPWLKPLTFGAAVLLALPDLNAFSSYPDIGEPYFYRYDTTPDVLSLALSFAYAFDDWLAVGAGILPTINSLQSNVTKVTLNGEGVPVDLGISQTGRVMITPIAGILLRPHVFDLEHLVTVGFSYRGQIKNVFGQGPTQVIYGSVGEDGVFHPLPPLNAEVFNASGFVPEQFTLGVGVTPAERLVLGFDVTHKQWSAYHYWLDQPPKPNFDNVFVYRVGGEYTFPLDEEMALPATVLDALTVRLGYYFEPSPEPDATLDGRQNILDSDQHVVSAGLGIGTRVMKKFQIRYDLLFQAHLLNDRSTANSGDSRFGPLTAKGTVYDIGVEANFAF